VCTKGRDVINAVYSGRQASLPPAACAPGYYADPRGLSACVTGVLPRALFSERTDYILSGTPPTDI
jgi:hypothetical protein